MAKHKSSQNGVETSAKQKDKSPIVPQRDKISSELHIQQRDNLTDKQKQLIDLILAKDTKIVFVTGPAGTSKTYCAVLAGLMLMNKKSVSDILFIRNIVESATKSLGSLPGEQDDKFAPFLQPLLDKLDELLPKQEVKMLQKEERVQGFPVNYLRGASFNAKCIIGDEMQNLSRGEIQTVITRLGKFSKMILCGDVMQSDIGKTSGFQHIVDLFNDESCRENGIYHFAFTKDDIVRSGVLKFIIERLEIDANKNAQIKNEPMFPVK